MNKTALLYRKYREQLRHMPDVVPMSEMQFSVFAQEHLKDLSCVETDGGFLYYDLALYGDRLHCTVPVYGYSADREQTAVRLFTLLAQRIAQQGACDYQVHLYSEDAEVIRAFHMMQFFTMAEKCVTSIRELCAEPDRGIVIRPVPKDELNRRWKEVWQAVHQIVLHLQASPVFYPGKEFTEEVYRGFFQSEETEVLAAFDGDSIVGIIEWNREPNLLMGGENSVNVGEIYVYPEYRDKNLSKALLCAAQQQAKAAGYGVMWVEHGTANPNARGFWNKYFQPYEYQLIRTIEPVR